MSALVVIGAVIGIICLMLSFFVGGAPQQAALAGMACAFAVLPYVLFRVSEASDRKTREKAFQDLVLKKLDEVVAARRD